MKIFLYINYMDNQYITILILFIFMIYLYNNNKKNNNFKNTLNKNIDNFTNKSTTISDSIKEVGQYSKDFIDVIKNNKEFNINKELIITGTSNIVPLKSIIIWTQESAPYPNTSSFPPSGDTYTLRETDSWYPCIGGVVNGINIPDLRGRMIYSFQRYNTNLVVRDGFAIRTHIGGHIPLRSHSHPATNSSYERGHVHKLPVYKEGDHGSGGGGWCAGRCRSLIGSGWNTRISGVSDRTGGGRHSHLKTSTTGYSGSHTHSITIDNTAHSGGSNYYTREFIPQSTVVQFWIRVQ